MISPRVLGDAAVLAALGVTLSSEGRGNERTLRGTAQRLGAGTIQSFLAMDAKGAPFAGLCSERSVSSVFQLLRRVAPAGTADGVAGALPVLAGELV